MVDEYSAVVKQEYVILRCNEAEPNDVQQCSEENGLDDEAEQNGGVIEVRQNDKEKARGRNKRRPPPPKIPLGDKLCPVLVDLAEGETASPCVYQAKCAYQHDVAAYLAQKPANLPEECWVYRTLGRCSRGLSCRFASEHVTAEGRNKVNWDLWKETLTNPSSLNIISKTLQNDLRKKKYDFSLAEGCVAAYRQPSPKQNGTLPVPTPSNLENDTEPVLKKLKEDKEKPIGPITDEDEIKFRTQEKKTIDWKSKLYLAPLTTVGNLPFRRICKQLGADITCGEMAMADSLVSGGQQEWALLRRHKSEDLFGVQVCGNNPHIMTKCAQLIQEQAEVDFIDINMGCPIDLVYQKGCGSGLMVREKPMAFVVSCMAKVLNVPLTVKMRTGVYADKKIAHTVAPKCKSLGAAMICVHGRSREQRYTRSADWEYVNTVAEVCQPLPVFGNGDIMSYDDYRERTELYPHIAGTMIGRGALVKPWLFTEIKEKRHWDISASQRLDLLKDYVHYGLEHWGSDNQGIEKTRRFLLEWLSFFHRYIPVGLLEHPPQKMNQRPPVYKGRDDLETLLASPNCADWIRISEMLLCPVPDDFEFLPKHKANSWK